MKKIILITKSFTISKMLEVATYYVAKKGNRKFIMIFMLLFGLRTVFAGTAIYNATTDRIEYTGVITIEEVYQQINNPAYLEKQNTNKYIIHKDMFGDKNSELDLSNSEFVFDGFWQILSYGKITMNDSYIYSINGQGLIKCYRGESGIDPDNFGLFANNLRWQETSLESNGNSNSFYYKSVITNSTMEGYTFPTSQNRLTPYWPSYINPLRIDYSLNSELRNLTFKDFTFSLPPDTWGAYNAMISLHSSEGVIIDSVTFDNINLNMRDNSGGSLIGKWSSSIQVNNVTGTRLNLGNGLGEHETSGASYTYSNISLEGINIPPSNLLTIGWNRYNHSGNIEKLTHAAFKNFITGIQSNTGGGIDVDDFLISDVITGASLGVVWSHSLLYGSPFGSRTLKHGRIQNAETGYDLRGTVKTTGNGEPIPEEWGLSTVYSEDVIINASDRALSSGGYDSGHRFYGLNDTYDGGNYDIYINRDDFQLNLINCSFNPAKTYVSGSESFIKDYKYLDVKVVDSCSNPISGATVVITNNTDVNYPPININGTVKSSFITGIDGHTLLPSDTANSAAILDFIITSTLQQEMSYTISASLGSNNGSVTGVQPDITWYRTNPMIPTETIVITLSGSCSVTGVNQTEGEKNNIAIYPNPSKGRANLEYKISERQNVQIIIYNLLGEELATIVNSEMSAGKYRFDLSAHLNYTGIYFIRIKTGNTVSFKKMLNLR